MVTNSFGETEDREINLSRKRKTGREASGPQERVDGGCLVDAAAFDGEGQLPARHVGNFVLEQHRIARVINRIGLHVGRGVGLVAFASHVAGQPSPESVLACRQRGVSVIAIPKTFRDVLMPVSVRERLPAFSKKSGEDAAVKLSVAALLLPDASIVAPPTVLMRIARLVLCGVVPEYWRVPPRKNSPMFCATSAPALRRPSALGTS